MVGIFLGAILGGVPGAIIGLIIGVVSSNKAISAGVGALTGSIITIVLFGTGSGLGRISKCLGRFAIPIGAFVGLIVSLSSVGLLSASRKTRYQWLWDINLGPRRTRRGTGARGAYFSI